VFGAMGTNAERAFLNDKIDLWRYSCSST
jgi:hypothetical protein